jgi:hypothetical protein
MMHLVEGAKVVQLVQPAASNGLGGATRYVDTRLAHRVFLLVEVTKGNAALTSFTLSQGTSAAGAGAAAFAFTVPIWSNLNTSAAAATDTLVRRANALTYALDNAADGRGQQVMFEIDPAKMDYANGRYYAGLTLGATDAANIISVTAFLVSHRYKQDVPPTAIV